MNLWTLAHSLCACFVFGLLAQSVYGELPRYGPSQKYGASQKSAKQKGSPPPPFKHEHHWWCGPPPPVGPILEPAAILRVSGPERPRFRLESERPEAGEEDPEAGAEVDPDIQALAESVRRLDQRVDDLYMSLRLLVDQLGK